MLLRDDFAKWNDSKIELLNVIDQFRQKLSRLGMLNEQPPAPDQNAAASNDGEKSGEANDDKAPKDWSEETIRNLLESSTLVAENTQVNFFVYKMDDLEEFLRNIDTVDAQMFYHRCIQDVEFQRKYNCGRIFI